MGEYDLKISELKYKPGQLPCCDGCEHKSSGIRYCVKVEMCLDILIHNDIITGNDSKQYLAESDLK